MKADKQKPAEHPSEFADVPLSAAETAARPGLFAAREVQDGAAQGLRDVEDLLASTARLVVLAPHPDDELLACGGLLALHAARGGRSCIIAVTDGEASVAPSGRWTPAKLAATRRAERLRGLLQLGAGDELVRLGLPDGRVGDHLERLVGATAMLLQAGDTLVTTWRHDGHPDHQACGRAGQRACAYASGRLLESPVWLCHPEPVSDGERTPWPAALRLVLPPAVRARKRQALAEHRSQFGARLSVCAQPGHVLDLAASDIELFFTG